MAYRVSKQNIGPLCVNIGRNDITVSKEFLKINPHLLHLLHYLLTGLRCFMLILTNLKLKK